MNLALGPVPRELHVVSAALVDGDFLGQTVQVDGSLEEPASCSFRGLKSNGTKTYAKAIRPFRWLL